MSFTVSCVLGGKVVRMPGAIRIIYVCVLMSLLFIKCTNKRNNEACSCIRCCSGKVISITYC